MQLPRKQQKVICQLSSPLPTSDSCFLRGLPPGYIATLEKRLAETEAALLQALSAIHSSEIQRPEQANRDATSTATMERPRELEYNEMRSAKVEEWRNYPLGTEDQQRSWLRHRIATHATLDSSGRVANATENDRMLHLENVTAETPRRTPARKRQKMQEPVPSVRDNAISNERQNHASDLAATTMTPREQSPLRPWAEDVVPMNLDSRHREATAPNMRARQTSLQHPESWSSVNRTAPEVADSQERVGAEEQEVARNVVSKAKRLSTLHSRKYF